MPDYDGDIEPQDRPPAPIPESRATLVVNARVTRPDVMVDRTSEFGNPFMPTRREDRDAVIDRFKAYFLTRVATEPPFRRRVLALKGKTLGCWCRPLPCHGTVIAEWLDASP